MTTHSERGAQFILTSATLGEGKDSFDEVISFAKRLCNSEFSKDDIVTGIREEYCAETEPVFYQAKLYSCLIDPLQTMDAVCSEYGIETSSTDKKEIYYDICVKSVHYHKLRQYLYSVDVSGFALSDISQIGRASCRERV